MGCKPLLNSSLPPRVRDFWALRHKDSDGLQFCRKQQNLLGYTSLAPELPSTWSILKLEKHLKSFSCGLDPGFKLLIKALWLYGV